MNDEQYIDIAIEISKKAKYPYGAILYEEFSKIVYAATLQDSNDNYCPEKLTNIDELAKYSKSKIEIVKKLHRDKSLNGKGYLLKKP